MTSVLKVDNIQNSSGTDAISIDSSGNVLKPKQCAFRVYRTTDSLDAQNVSTATLINFEAKDFDINNDFDLASDKFVAPVDGVYIFSMQVRLRYTEAATTTFIRFYKNGTSVWATNDYHYLALEDPQGGSYASPNGTQIVKLEAGDEMQVYIDVDGDASVSIQYGSTEFSGALLS